MVSSIEKFNQGYEDEQKYIGALKDYWRKFNVVALELAPEGRMSLYHGPYGEERYRFEFDQYEDAQALESFLIDQGFGVVIKEPGNNNKPMNGRKYFEVTQKDFAKKDDFIKDNEKR